MRVFEPFGPSASAKAVTGIRHHHCGLAASPFHIGLARSATLLTGLGLAVGDMPLSRSGKPQAIDWSVRTPPSSRMTNPGVPGYTSAGAFVAGGSATPKCAATSAALLLTV